MKILWSDLDSMDRSVLADAWTYSELSIDIDDSERMDAAQWLNDSELLHLVEVDGNKIVYEITPKGEAVYQSGERQLIMSEPANTATVASQPDGAGVTAISAFAKAAQGDMDEAAAIYEAAALGSVISELEAENARLLGIIERATTETAHWIMDTDADWQAGYRDIYKLLTGRDAFEQADQGAAEE